MFHVIPSSVRNIMRPILLAVLLSVGLGRIAQAHSDVLLYISGGSGSGTGITGGKLMTGGFDDGLPVQPADPLLPNPVLVQRVFGYDFGEEPSDPYIIGDPGFNNSAAASVGITPNNGVLPNGSVLGITPVSILFYWDGNGAVNFTPAPAGVELGFKRGSTTGLVSNAGTLATFPTIGTTDGLGRLHVHTESQLNFTDGADPALPNAPEGIYYYGAILSLSTGGVAASDPIYFAYNNGLTETQHDEAISFIENNIAAVPEPGTWACVVCCLGAVGYWGGKKMRRQVSAAN